MLPNDHRIGFLSGVTSNHLNGGVAPKELANRYAHELTGKMSHVIETHFEGDFLCRTLWNVGREMTRIGGRNSKKEGAGGILQSFNQMAAPVGCNQTAAHRLEKNTIRRKC